MSLRKQAEKAVGKIVNAVISSVAQTSNKGDVKEYPPVDGIGELCRAAAAESAVLLKNEKNVLPVTKDDSLAVFGRVQSDTFYVGYGSGGDVNAHYKVSFIEGLKSNSDIHLNKELMKKYEKWRRKNKVDDGFWGHWPMSYEEMPLDSDTIEKAAQQSGKAVIFIGRAAGEDRENTLTKGSYYLSDTEEELIKNVSAKFEKCAVVLNIGGIFDFSWVEKYDIPCVLIVWQGGMEAGNAAADIISGKLSPSGCLTDTIARCYENYPSADNFGGRDKNVYAEDIFVGYRYFETFEKKKVLFPFGLGLSYSEFDIKVHSFSCDNGRIHIAGSVKNTGGCRAKKSVQLYYSAPQAKLTNPEKQLCAFIKTKELEPGGVFAFSFNIDTADLASYDDSGISGFKSAYVLEKGRFVFYIGFDVRDNVNIGEFVQENTVVVKQLTQVAATEEKNAFMRLRALSVDGKIYKTFEPSPVRSVELKKKILENLPSAVPVSVGHGYKLSDVKSGKITIGQFVAELDYTELEAISRGDYVMNSPLGPKGNAGVFCGVTQSLRDKGVPPICCTDGPSGIRLAVSSALLPSGTALASTWNTDLVCELYSLLAQEMKARGSHVLLAPGMNIHRNPLCGRNFEYFSEDPFLTGHMATAVVNGLQSAGVSACPKHFACNNQETRRTRNNSVLSERALREIYLKGFEICVKKSRPLTLMTSYNKINGVWGHYNYELVHDILRGEWGYEGCVMTDWWMRSASSPEFPELRNQAYRLRAGVNVLMPGGARSGKRAPDGTLLETLGRENGITTAELQLTAAYVLNCALKLNLTEQTGE